MAQNAKRQFYDLAEYRQQRANQKPITDRMLDVHEVADMIGSSKSTIYRMWAAGEFPTGVKYGKRNRRWPESVIKKWSREKEQGENQ